jgi:hypothetical protein
VPGSDCEGVDDADAGLLEISAVARDNRAMRRLIA